MKSSLSSPLSTSILFGLKTKERNYRRPTKSAENGHLHSERRAIQDILANSTDYLVAVALRPNFSSIAPMNRSSLAFPWKSWFYAAAQK